MPLQIGSTIGDYQIVGILGAGGMGQVYKVRNVISDRVEAMKVLLPDLANAPDLAERFLREIKVQASMEHPNIAALHTAVRVDNQLLMLMEFVDGVSLEQKLKDGVLPVGDAVDYIRQVLAALDYAHQHGVVHRDIKPANMMLTPTGVVKLMDFGIAKASSDHKLTMTGTTMGSLYYMSPEQIQGAATLDGRSDLYSVGVALYELVTGKRPFDGDSQFAIMSAHLEKTPVPPIALDPRLPRPLNDMILMAVSRDPNQRFQTAGALRNALGSIVAAPAPVPAAAPLAPPRAASAPGPAAPAAPAAVAAKVAPDYRIAQPTAPANPNTTRRGLWIAIGALTTAAVVIGLIEFGPWKGSKAAPPVSTPAVAAQPAATPAPQEQTPPVATPADAKSTPADSKATSAPVQVSTPAASATPQKLPPAPNAKPAHAGQSASEPPAPVLPPLQPRPVEQSQSPVQQPAAQADSKPANSSASREQILAVREDFMKLNTRAIGIHTTLQSLERSQAARGQNLRGDMQEASGLMDNYLAAADAAVKASDIPAAKGYMDKAERQIEKLEKFLNR